MSDDAAHIPVLIAPLIERALPVSGTWADGTFGAGGYAGRCWMPGPTR